MADQGREDGKEVAHHHKETPQEPEEDDEPLDPRVENALGDLNQAIDSVNATEGTIAV